MVMGLVYQMIFKTAECLLMKENKKKNLPKKDPLHCFPNSDYVPFPWELLFCLNIKAWEYILNWMRPRRIFLKGMTGSLKCQKPSRSSVVNPNIVSKISACQIMASTLVDRYFSYELCFLILCFKSNELTYLPWA